jgi:hypothetical protein
MAHRRTQEANTDAPDPERTTGGSDDTFSLPRRRYVRNGAATLAALVGIAGRTAARTTSGETEHHVLIQGTEAVSRYELTVDGELKPERGASEDASARISGRSAEGVVRDGSRRYRFSGGIRDVAVDGDADIYVATERIDPAQDGIERLRRDVPDFSGRPR